MGYKIFRNVGNRCAVILKDLCLPVSESEALKILLSSGYHDVSISWEKVVELMREYIGVSEYKRGATMQEAPDIFDCSSASKWAYGRRGIYIPRYSIQQRAYLQIKVDPKDIRAGDLVFTTGRRNYFDLNPNDNVGHVGLATNDGTVIHAANKKLGLIESPYDQFAEKFRGIRRLVDDESKIVTIESPAERITEDSDYFRWKILQKLQS